MQPKKSFVCINFFLVVEMKVTRLLNLYKHLRKVPYKNRLRRNF